MAPQRKSVELSPAFDSRVVVERRVRHKCAAPSDAVTRGSEQVSYRRTGPFSIRLLAYSFLAPSPLIWDLSRAEHSVPQEPMCALKPLVTQLRKSVMLFYLRPLFAAG